jgi:hypothetical protein
MANKPIQRGGATPVNLATAQAANAVSTDTAILRSNDRQFQGSLLRIIAATGTACDYLLEGSGDASVWYPLPWQNVISGSSAALTLNSGLFHVAAAGTFWLLIPVDIPWAAFRVTSSNQVGSMVNTYDLWSY